MNYSNVFKNGFNKEEVRNEIESKITERNIKKFVTHNCALDGTLCALFAKTYLNLDIGGIWKIRSQTNSFSNLAYNKADKLNDMLFIDCAVTNDKKLTIDHHSTVPKFFYDDGYNVNKYSIYSDQRNKYNFFHKNPTSNVLWLMFLFDVSVDALTKPQKLILCMADGLFECYNNKDFRPNVINWLGSMNQLGLLEVLEHKNISNIVQEAKWSLGLADDAYITYRNEFDDWFICNKYGVPTENYYTKRITPAQKLYDKLAEIMMWDSVQIPKFDVIDQFDNKIEPIWKSGLEGKHATNAIVNMRDGTMFTSYYSGKTDFDVLKKKKIQF
jgi:hypothetical protein